MNRQARFQRLACLAAFLVSRRVHAQITAAAPAFESASVRPAPADASTNGLGFMISLGRQTPPRGLLTMTGPLAPFVMFAYGVDDEVEARAMRARLPEWAQRQKFTIVARPPQDTPTQEQLRGMMRTLLEDRFALQAHRVNHNGPVNTLVVAKPGVTGPGLKPHETAQTCLERESTGKPSTPEPGTPVPVYCGLDLYQTGGGIFHVSMVDVTLAEASTMFGGLGGVLGGRSMQRVVDGTGLPGRWDITLDFLPERDGPAADPEAGDIGGPSFSAALEKQLGLRLKKGTGQIEELVVDRISQPTPD